MAYYVCDATAAELESTGYCPSWVEVTGITTTGTPVDISFLGQVTAENILTAWTLGLGAMIGPLFVIYGIKELLRLQGEALK